MRNKLDEGSRCSGTTGPVLSRDFREVASPQPAVAWIYLPLPGHRWPVPDFHNKPPGLEPIPLRLPTCGRSSSPTTLTGKPVSST